MRELRWEAAAAMLAFVISLGFVWNPGPYFMGAFTFIAQPLFVLAGLSYALKVIRDLKGQGVL